MDKIFSLARNLIFAVMAEFNINFDFTAKETAWKATRVEEELVTFEIHEKIKNLIEKEVSEASVDAEKVMFEFKGDSIWEVEIQANGAESYFFSRLLFMASARLRSGVIDIQSLNYAVIERHTAAAAMKVIGNTISFVAKAGHDNKGRYSITVPVSGMTITFANENVDLLCKGIGSQLRGLFPPKKTSRKQKR